MENDFKWGITIFFGYEIIIRKSAEINERIFCWFDNLSFGRSIRW